MLNGLAGSPYGMVWVDIEINPSSGCSWSSHSYGSNCNFVVDLINELKSHGKEVGVYTSQYEWEHVMGSLRACPAAASASNKLWYAHFDNSPSFRDFVQIGGWTHPNMK